MIAELKRILYFPIASYFRFFARIRLLRWHPKIIVVTGSNGKTTLLHLLESQIGEKAKYTHHANSSYGIPFDILELHRHTLLKSEWISLFLKAPLNVFLPLPKQSLYIVEADCDRPGEGKFLAELLKPDIVLWVSVARTHGMNFDKLGKVEEAIAYEFGYFLEYCKKLAVVNGDLPLELQQTVRSKAAIKVISKKNYLQKYEISEKGTSYRIGNKTYTFSSLLPEEVFCSIAMCEEAAAYLELPFDPAFPKFTPPPGRSSIFRGIYDIAIVDSSYNANLSSMKAILNMFQKISGKKKWAVVGDMLEQGKGEKTEHEKLAELLNGQEFERIILMGPRVGKYTYPLLNPKNNGENIIIKKFEHPRETLDYLVGNISGGETILFKGARFMEGIVEHLLQDKAEAAKLARREKIWDIRRKKWGL